jgi:hypothetical protein
MEHSLNENDIKWHDLVQRKDFEDLDERELHFVLSYSDEEDYRMMRAIEVEAPLMFTEETSTLKAPPLMLSNKKGAPVVLPIWKRGVPMYQTLLAVAASIIFMWFINKPSWMFLPIKNENTIEYITHTDTIVETQLITDTIVQYKYINKPVVVEKITYINIPSDSEPKNTSTAEEPRMLNPSNQFTVPIEDKKPHPASNSYKNDPTKELVYDVNWGK